MNYNLTQLINRIKQRVYLSSDKEIGEWIDEYAQEKVKAAIELARVQETSPYIDGLRFTEQEIIDRLFN